jgi:hypothetical protein
MPNEVAFSARQTVEPPDGAQLGQVDTTPYERIRVLASCNAFSASGVEVALDFVQGEGVPGALDRFLLVPGDNLSQVYEVPGVLLLVIAQPTTDGSAFVELIIWGYRSPGD